MEKEEAIAILSEMGKLKNSPKIDIIEKALSDLMTVNESPRNILDSVILSGR
jgi:hypothetical protein